MLIFIGFLELGYSALISLEFGHPNKNLIEICPKYFYLIFIYLFFTFFYDW